MSGSKLTGRVRDKRGTPITGISCDVNVYDKDTRSTHLGSTTTVVDTGRWAIKWGDRAAAKVLVVVSSEDRVGPDQYVAGAEYMESQTTSTSSTTSSTTTTV